MTKILGLSGKKQSGKNTCLNWLVSCQLVAQELVDWARINEKGQIIVPTMVNNRVEEGIFDIENPSQAVQTFLKQFIYPVIKPYSFATPLKRFCVDVLGLTEKQVFGTNEDKETLTNIMWENVPGVITNQKLYNLLGKTIASKINKSDDTYEDLHFVLTYHEAGPMTAREVLQHFGTNICRRLFNDCWVAATLKQIEIDQPELAVITDLRFPNEVYGVQKAGGKVLRFLRAPFADSDSHPSETALDNFDGFDSILDNRSMTIPEQNKAVHGILQGWKFDTYEVVEKLI